MCDNAGTSALAGGAPDQPSPPAGAWMAAEHPILFTGPMVRAILDGTKTQTRRVMKAQPRANAPTGWYLDAYDGGPQWNWWDAKDRVCNADDIWRCPYGVPGDRLWVRETWQAWACMSPEYDEWDLAQELGSDIENHTNVIEYRATSKSTGPWRPSIFMPRWASRLLLEITDMRAERVQEITGEGAQAEGIHVLPLQDPGDPSAWWESAPGEHQARTSCGAFRLLWDSINAKRGEKKSLVEPWELWTWAESPEGDPEALGLDIAEPDEIRWRNLADEDEAEWTRFGDSQPSCAGMYDVVWESGDAPRSVYLQKCEEIEGEHHSFQSYSWEANPWVWVVSFKKVEAA